MTPRGRSGAGLRVAPQLSFPLDAVTETFAILAKRRAGKSNAAVVMAEEMHAAGLPWVAVDPKGDWWGLRASSDGRSPGLAVVVFGGLHSDVPLLPTAGRVVADLVARRRLTAVLDVSEMTKADQRRFLADFAEHLYRANREPLHVFAEEADEYIPQQVRAGDARLVGAWESLIKRGGFRGIGVTLITQRSASLNKDVLTQVETLIAMRTPSPQDRKAILAWVDQHEAGSEAVGELPSLASGEAWVFSPQWLQTLVKITFRRRRTFDSGATPTVGVQQQSPARLAPVDLVEIEQAMAETIERAEALDPMVLQKRVRQLERQLAAQPASSPTPEPVERVVEVPVVTEQTVQQLAEVAADLRGSLEAHREAVAAAQQVVAEASAQVRHLEDTLATLTTKPRSPSGRTATQQQPPRRTTPATRPPARATSIAGSDGAGAALRSGAYRMVEALGRMAPLRLSKGQWGTVARLKTSGGTWSTYLSDIRRAGLLDESPAGYTLTNAGFDYLGGRPDPMSAGELQAHYRQILRSGAVKMLDALLDTHPAGLTRDDLGTAADLATSGGTFSTYLSDLVRNGLAERDGDTYRATDILVHGAH